MTYEEFLEYYYRTYCQGPLSAQVDKQDGKIFHLKMELAKLKKKIDELTNNKED